MSAEREAFQAIMRSAEALKEPCSTDPESPAAIRNGKLATIAQIAAQGLGLVRGPTLGMSAPLELQRLLADARDTLCEISCDSYVRDLIARIDATLGAAPQTQAAADVLAERARQIAVEGWTIERDDRYLSGQLPQAAACYALGMTAANGCNLWPWEMKWWKPSDKRRNYVRAAALMLAEIERLDRASAGALSGAPLNPQVQQHAIYSEGQGARGAEALLALDRIAAIAQPATGGDDWQGEALDR